MNKEALRGMALILFGILLGVCGAEINQTMSVVDLPFSFVGLIAGAVGLWMVFNNTAENRQIINRARGEPRTLLGGFYPFFRRTMAMKFRYFPPPASMAFRSPRAYSLSCFSQSAHTSSLLSISCTERTSAP